MSLWGIIPAAGKASRMRPLAFSKELLPVGSRREGDRERPRAVSEYVVERMALAGATRICFVIAPGKSDILEYYGAGAYSADICYTVQPRPAGLCDAIFRARSVVAPGDEVVVGLPDTVWFPEDALRALPAGRLALLLFPAERPERFDAVLTDAAGSVLDVRVKQAGERWGWIWGAFRMPGEIFAAMHRLWLERGRADQYMGTLVNAWLAAGGSAAGVRAGTAYVDVGTLDGYREAMRLLERPRAVGGFA